MTQTNRAWFFLFSAWVLACIATAGSLFFSEVMQFMPCVLCWYQRIAMYPLVIILLVGLLKGAKEAYLFALPIALIGWLIALYHNLLHYGIVPESAAPCRQGVSCSTVYIELFGFLTIPMMSFLAFSSIISILLFLKHKGFYEK